MAHHIDAAKFKAVIQCESQWDTHAVSKTNDYGIAQIHLKSHPDITREQAEDPYFALNWAAQEWQAGRAHEWSCYRG